MAGEKTGSTKPITPPGRNLLKCRYCEWQTALWSKGKPSGWGRLRSHNEDYHRPEAIERSQADYEFYGDIVDEYQAEWETGVR